MPVGREQWLTSRDCGLRYGTDITARSKDGSVLLAAIDDNSAADQFTTTHQSKLVRSETMLPAGPWQPHKRKSFSCASVRAAAFATTFITLLSESHRKEY